MKIAMFTNTYLPHVGGVAKSVDVFARAFRSRGHETLIVCPTYDDQPEGEEHVFRVPAIRNFRGSRYSVALPLAIDLRERMAREFRPDIVHSHHPFLLGDTALRLAIEESIPIVFTHHTRYDRYATDSEIHVKWMRPFLVSVATEYANSCNGVIAPSESVAEMIRRRGVKTPIRVVPTGVDIAAFAQGDGHRARRACNIPRDAFVVGHVGRLAPEKNLGFLAQATARFLKDCARSFFLVGGTGRSESEMKRLFEQEGVADRSRFAGTLKGKDLIDTYHAMDVFVFASQTETQGMVLAEAAAAGCPMVAVAAPGAREVVRDGENGRLLVQEDVEAFAAAIAWVERLPEKRRRKIERTAWDTAKKFRTEACVEKALAFYDERLRDRRDEAPASLNGWSALLRSLQCEYDIWANRLVALAETIAPEEARSEEP